MSSSNRTGRALRARLLAILAPAIAASLLPSGCGRSEMCAAFETCNYRDDNCNGVADEGFTDGEGRYTTDHDCGSCGVDCGEVFPTAAETACDATALVPRCRIVSCPEGTHLAGTSACVPDVPPTCLPCETDRDCAFFDPTAHCEAVGGSMRCTASCTTGVPCPPGFDCEYGGPAGPRCLPASGECACLPATAGAEFACLLAGYGSTMCAGEMECDGTSLGECTAVLAEICDGLDDDCDGEVDEDFKTPDGRYVHEDHCGACDSPCRAPGPHMVASCTDTPVPACEIGCEADFVDLDGVHANGCECQRTVGTWPPSRLGVDADCDGVIDDSDEFVFVSPRGSDLDPGTLVFPMRTLPAAIPRAAALGKTVVVSSGAYAGPVDLAAGVDVFGGYSSDFGDRDPDLYPTTISNPGGEGGLPVLRARDLRTATTISGFTVTGSDAGQAGQGSTTIMLSGCGPELVLEDILVIAGRGEHGATGPDSSENLSDWGLSSLLDLEGRDGSTGGNGVESSSPSCSGVTIGGGNGGPRTCPGGAGLVDGGDGGDAACPRSGCVNGSPCGNAGCTDFMEGGVCDVEAVFAAAVPNPPAEDGSGPGAGAAGEQTYDSPTNRDSCHFCDDSPPLHREGQNGEPGGSGGEGTGGQGCVEAWGVFDAVTGRWRATAGMGGTAGTDGGGGGGGTCGSGFEVIPWVTDCNDVLGGSGGGGGSGGCGAPGADGGQGGGWSIAVLVVLGAGLTEGPGMVDVTIVTAAAGDGGDGGIGAEGGSGGAGGTGGFGGYWCARSGGRGGDGGGGGAGGGGGGGCGGSVAGVMILASGPGSEPYRDGLSLAVDVASLASAGAGGGGGFSPGASGMSGLTGTSSEIRLVW